MNSSSSRLSFALLLAGVLGTGCAASTDNDIGETDFEPDAATRTDAPVSETDSSTGEEDDAGDVEDSGTETDAEADGGDEPGADAGVDSSVPDTGTEEPIDSGTDEDADVPPEDAGPDVNPGPVCGDWKVEGDEECDDGNTTDGDGCDSHCRIERPPTEYDKCEGVTITLTGSGDEIRRGGISGSTTLLTHDYTATCSGATPNGKDAVFKVVPDVDGRMRAWVAESTFDEILYARTTCAATGTTSLKQCSASSTAYGMESVEFPVSKGVPIFLIVDSKDLNTAGTFRLEVEVTPGYCGNGVIDGAEACDDGNTNRGDGCDETCKIEATPTRDTCAGEQLILTGNPPSAKVTHGNVNLASNYTAVSGTPCYVANSKDAVYQVTPAVDGRLVAKLKANFDASIYARGTSCTSTTAASQLACSNSQPANGEEVISFPVTKQTNYWLFVETHDGQNGMYDLEVTVHPAVCGNGVRDGNEECDGDDVPPGYLCDTDCTLWRPADDKCPGEPLTLTGPEGGPWTISFNGTTLNYFDDAVSSTCHFTSVTGTTLGTPTGPDATYLITPPADGQLRVQVSSSVFDPVLYARSSCATPNTELGCINATSGKPSTEELVLPVRKDVPVTIFVDAYQTGTGGAFSFTAELKPAVCGDGKLDGNEECDDGNAINGDGCNTACKLEMLSGLNVCPGMGPTWEPLGAGLTATITASTANLTNRYNNVCSSQTYGPEAIFKVVPPWNAYLNATLTSNFNAVLYTSTACMPSSTPSCTNRSNGIGAEWLNNVSLNANQTYYLYVDGITTGDGPASGVFNLTVTLTPR